MAASTAVLAETTRSQTHRQADAAKTRFYDYRGNAVNRFAKGKGAKIENERPYKRPSLTDSPRTVCTGLGTMQAMRSRSS